MNKMLKKVKLSLTRIMCRTSQAHSSCFVRGYKKIDCTLDFWTYFKFVCTDVNVHGPYVSHQKCLKMRSYLDLCSSSEKSYTEIMRFETIRDMSVLDSVLGQFARYGSVELRDPQTAQIMQETHKMSTIGHGMAANETSGKLVWRGHTKLGIDFKYNTSTDSLSISVRYKVVNVCDDSILQSFLSRRQELTSGRPSSSRDKEVQAEIKTSYVSTIKRGMNSIMVSHVISLMMTTQII